MQKLTELLNKLEFGMITNPYSVPHAALRSVFGSMNISVNITSWSKIKFYVGDDYKVTVDTFKSTAPKIKYITMPCLTAYSRTEFEFIKNNVSFTKYFQNNVYRKISTIDINSVLLSRLYLLRDFKIMLDSSDLNKILLHYNDSFGSISRTVEFNVDNTTSLLQKIKQADAYFDDVSFSNFLILIKEVDLEYIEMGIMILEANEKCNFIEEFNGQHGVEKSEFDSYIESIGQELSTELKSII